MLAVAVTILGLAAAPALDTDEPWFDYETWALSSASSKSTSFSWDHSYGPLDWPRDGRELLRVKAKRPAYWKATNLDDFDGRRWIRDRSSTNLDGCDVSAYLSEGAEQEPAADPRHGAQPAHADVRHRGRGVRDRLAAAGLAAARRRHVREHEPRAAPRRRLRRARLHAQPERRRAPRGAAHLPGDDAALHAHRAPAGPAARSRPGGGGGLARLPGAVPDVRRARAPDDAVARRPGLGLRPGGTAPARGPLRAHLRARPAASSAAPTRRRSTCRR